MITVVNKRHGPHSGAIYAGRPGILGNPFVVGVHGARGECVKLFREWYTSNPAAESMRAFAASLPDDAVLECWCVPAECHAQVIADIENTRRKGAQP